MNATALHVIRLVATAAAIFLLPACQIAPGGAPPGFAAASVTRTLTMRTSGFVFPETVGKFHRSGATQFDTAGQDLSVKSEISGLVVVDVYEYPTRGNSLLAELRLREGEVKLLHPDARRISEESVTVSPGGSLQRGMKAVFAFAQNFRPDIPPPYRSQLLLFERAGRFIKYRATYPERQSGAAEREIRNFVAQLAWPPQ